VQIHEKYRDQDVQFVGFTGDDGRQVQQMQDYLEQFGITWPNGYGASKLGRQLGVRGYPTTMVFDRSGKMVWSGHSAQELDQAIERTLKRP
jgi:hypothetical protein